MLASKALKIVTRMWQIDIALGALRVICCETSVQGDLYVKVRGILERA